MTWFRFLAAISLLFVPSASSMPAEREQFRIRSAFVGAAGEVSAVVELPPGSTAKSTDFQLLINDRVAATARETQDQRLNLMFLVDVSGSMKGPPLNDAKNALPSFLSKARPQDQFALTSFADEDNFGRHSRTSGKKSTTPCVICALKAKGQNSTRLSTTLSKKAPRTTCGHARS